MADVLCMSKRDRPRRVAFTAGPQEGTSVRFSAGCRISCSLLHVLPRGGGASFSFSFQFASFALPSFLNTEFILYGNLPRLQVDDDIARCLPHALLTLKKKKKDAASCGAANICHTRPRLHASDPTIAFSFKRRPLTLRGCNKTTENGPAAHSSTDCWERHRCRIVLTFTTNRGTLRETI